MPDTKEGVFFDQPDHFAFVPGASPIAFGGGAVMPGPMDPFGATPQPSAGNAGVPAGGLGFNPTPGGFTPSPFPLTNAPTPQFPTPFGFDPNIPGGGTNQFNPAPLQPVGEAGCRLLPTQQLRDICLAGLGFITGQFGGGGPAIPQMPGTGTGGGGGVPGTAVGAFHATHFGGVAIQPTLTAVSRWKCPRFANGMGILWVDASGGVTCLPRTFNGAALGLVRKNPRTPKPLFSHADAKVLKRADRLEKKLSKVAKRLKRGR